MISGRAFREPAVRPRWSGASYLHYLGAFVVLFAALGLIASLVAKAGGHRDLAAVGWSALTVAVVTAVALGLRRRRHDVLAGLAAFVAVILLGVLAASLVKWLGIGLGRPTGPLQRSFEPGLYIVEVVVAAAGIAAIAFFRFPLLVLAVAGTALYAAVDIGTTVVGREAGAGVPSLVAAIAGVVLVFAGISVDLTGLRSYGFWLHFLGGLAIGESLFYLASHGELGWVVVAAGAFAYVAAARALGRSSYAVLGSIGVLVVSSHWIGKWLGVLVSVPFLPGFAGGRPEPWHVALAYVAVGVVLVLLGVLALPRHPEDVVVVPGEPEPALESESESVPGTVEPG